MLPLVLSALALLLAGSTVQAPIQQDRGASPYTVAVDVDLVLFNVTVTERGGNHVAGLTQNDFQVTEEGRPQAITLFHAEDVPSSIGIIIDNSGSMRDKSATVKEAALGFLKALNSEDELFTVSFNEKVYLGLPESVQFTNDMNQVRTALLRVVPAGMTALYDALAGGLDHLKTGTRDRKALVVLSDGGDNASRRNLDNVLLMARQASATIYTIGMYDEADMDSNPRVLKRIAQDSGGRSYFPKSPQKMQQVWLDIANAIRSQYTIGYVSNNTGGDGGFRKVKIAAKRQGRAFAVQTREGYIAPSK